MIIDNINRDDAVAILQPAAKMSNLHQKVAESI